ncbi:MAG: hypothetical protein U0176_14930 [Bacteroidia bacterium]
MNNIRTLLLALSLILSSTLIAQAQTEKGHWMIGLKSSGLGFQVRKGSFYVALSPEGGYFLADHLALGAHVGLNVGRQVTSNFTGSGFGIAFTPFLRYYIPFREKLSFPINIAFGAGAHWTTGDIYYSTIGLNGSATAGIAYFPIKHLSLDFLIGYDWSRYGSNNSTFPATNNGALIGGYGATLYFGK